MTDDVSLEDDRMIRKRLGVSHRGGSVSLLYQDVSSTVVDVLEAVRTQ